MPETRTPHPHDATTNPRFQNLPRLAFAPVPLFLIQPALKRIVFRVARQRPELFARLGPHKDTVYIIDPVNLPFILRLYPNPGKPSLTAHRRREAVPFGARISGSFLTLLKMIDGRLDGDSLFFARSLKVEGNTEAVVCLRNALDDLEGSIVDDISSLYGPPSKIVMRALSAL